ncbi:MAG: helix-turn-helix transcriptional regulator [Treponema sp.]|jgi:two-component system response regulator YesN|nr:helix-turn-helix transcriptional regulator [Treponema sp.]
MVNIARELRLEIRQKWFSDVLKADSPEEFRKNVLEISERICASKLAQSKDTSMAPIMEFIRLHSCDYEMSLEMLREQFGYSITQLSHMIKDYAGESFRNYVTTLRMEKAREFLKTDASIAEISSLIGYGSVSHFIKTFRSFYGKNPSSFRDRDIPQP